MKRAVLLSFDVEEFDIPLEYGQAVEPELQMEVSATGAAAILDLLDDLGITATFFTTALFALHRPDLIRRMAKRHEVASHGYSHARFVEEDLLRSKQVIEEIAAVPVVGFRRARLETTNIDALCRAGYLYDSSINPIFLPGRYNHFCARRTAHRTGGLLQIPISATPWLRFPLFWLAFKNSPTPLTRVASWINLETDGYLNLFFHPWEFSDLRAYQLPWCVKSPDGAQLLAQLKRHLQWLQKKARFLTLAEFTRAYRGLNSGSDGSSALAP